MRYRVTLPLFTIATVLLALSAQAWGQAQDPSISTADHSKFEELKGPFESGPQLTKACLGCHTEAAKQIMGSIHWTWSFEHPQTEQVLGKRRVINSFCGNVATNEARCTSCHAGYGWDDTKTFDFSVEANVDCLICHDQTGEYVKWPDHSGHPLYEPKTSKKRFPLYPASLVTDLGNGKFRHDPPDLVKIAQEVGSPGRDACGKCHFFGGGGDNVKHGDISSVLSAPSRDVDVHMSPDGADMACTGCHTAQGHEWPGSRYLGTVADKREPVPGAKRPDVATCDSCHTDTPHDSLSLDGIKLNNHTDRIACQTCHIPAFARGGKATKTWWDWSTAGQLKDGKPYAERGEDKLPSYNTLKGSFEWGADVVPDYEFWNGVVEYTLLGETIDPEGIVDINRIYGSADDPDSRIYPFKIMRGKQAYDRVHNHLLMNDLYGPGSDTAFWVTLDWSRSLAAGMADTGVPFSGEFDFVETQMWWPTTHMVAPAEDALKCGECHAGDGRLAAIGGLYIPGRDLFATTDRIGLWLLALTVAGVIGHGVLRVLTHKPAKEDGS